jgi:uncharacterized protein (DUF1697 family)
MSSTTWIALLRGINVGRNNRVSMADLRDLLESVGYDDVQTHGQSGNALFVAAAGKRQGAAIEDEIATRMAKDLDLDVKVVARTADELAAVVEANPFPGRGVGPKELHAAFLSGRPTAKQRSVLEDLDAAEFAPDEFELGDRVIYLRLPDGVMGSRLPNWERLLPMNVTARNWNTVSRLHELAGG